MSTLLQVPADGSKCLCYTIYATKNDRAFIKENPKQNILAFCINSLFYTLVLTHICIHIDFNCFTFTTFTYPIVMDCRGATGVLATNSLHFSRLSAFFKVSLSSNPVHPLILSPHLFFCLPLFFPPVLFPVIWFCKP